MISPLNTGSGLAVFTRLGSRPIPRVQRMMEAAADLGYDVVFLSARREPGLPEIETSGSYRVERIGPFFPLLNGRFVWLYIKAVIRYNWVLFWELRRRRPVLVHCSDIETMVAGVVYRFSSGCRLLYNVHDNLAQRYNVPRPARVVLNACEGVAVLCSSQTVVPEAYRRDALPTWCVDRISVVRNTPVDRGMVPPLEAHVPIRIFYGGWVDAGRGLRELLELVRTNEDFEMTLAGEGDPELIREVISAPRTRYLGFITHDQIMAETASSHVVAALYDPLRPINRYAASNKIAEALSCGRPALVNSEMLMAGVLAAYGCVTSVPYAAVPTQAAQKLRKLVDDSGGHYASVCAAARKTYDDLFTWEVAKQAMVAAITGRHDVLQLETLHPDKLGSTGPCSHPPASP